MTLTRALGVGAVVLVLGGGFAESAAGGDTPSPQGGAPSPEFDVKVRKHGGDYKGSNVFASPCATNVTARKKVGNSGQGTFDITIKNSGDAKGDAILVWDTQTYSGAEGSVRHFRNGNHIPNNAVANGLTMTIKAGKSKTIEARVKVENAFPGGYYENCYLEDVQGDHGGTRVFRPL